MWCVYAYFVTVFMPILWLLFGQFLCVNLSSSFPNIYQVLGSFNKHTAQWKWQNQHLTPWSESDWRASNFLVFPMKKFLQTNEQLVEKNELREGDFSINYFWAFMDPREIVYAACGKNCHSRLIIFTKEIQFIKHTEKSRQQWI